MSKFAPVFLPPGRELKHRVSATFLRHFDLCERSGYLYSAFKGEAATPEMSRGSAFHAVAERCARACLDPDKPEPTIPPEIAKAVLDEVLTEYSVPIHEHDYLRESVARWSAEMAFPPPDRALAVETLFHLDIGGWQVRCKIDYAESLDDGARVAVYDWKTQRSLPSYEEIARRRPDGSLAAKNLQLILYALCLAWGVPVRVEEVDGERVEYPEPFPVASRAQEFSMSFVYPAIEDQEGRMARREVTLTRLELEEYRQSLAALVERVQRAEETGDWPAQYSSEACSMCPAAPLCPIPVELRNWRGTVNTPEQAREAAEVLAREKDDHAARQKELRLYAKANGGRIRFGADQVWEFGFQESERIADKDAMFAAMERAVRYGEDFDRSEFVKKVSSTPFRQRSLTVAELDEEQATETKGSSHE